MATTAERIAELKAQRDDLDKRIAALEAEAGAVGGFIDFAKENAVDTGNLSIDGLAALIDAWEKFQVK